MAFTLLTIVTQLGGLAWLAALFFRRRLLAFLAFYVLISGTAVWVGQLAGREPLHCTGDQPLQMQSLLYCALNRRYVVPELARVVHDHADAMNNAFPGTVTQVLDANFPFVAGFPMLPHLSHHDGRKADLAFYYRDEAGYLPAQTRSPIGYFAFEDGPTECPARRASMRWDMGWVQPMWPAYPLDAPRMRAALRRLSADPRVGKIFIEPHLKQSLGVTSDKIRFQGCRAARHEDHIHMQL